MEELKRRFPNDVDYTIPLDTTKAVTAGMHESSSHCSKRSCW